MESTGIYWKPVHTILEGHFELITPITSRPCRTDVKDAEWTADLVRHGLVKPSFVPPPPIRVTWSGYGAPWPRHWPPSRTARSSCWNIKLASSQVFGVSGRAMLKALIENTATPQEMADLAKRSLRRKPGAGRPADRASPLPSTSGGSRGGSARARRAHRREGPALRGAAAPAPADPRC
jgi:transposase